MEVKGSAGRESAVLMLAHLCAHGFLRGGPRRVGRNSSETGLRFREGPAPGEIQVESLLGSSPKPFLPILIHVTGDRQETD